MSLADQAIGMISPGEFLARLQWTFWLIKYLMIHYNILKHFVVIETKKDQFDQAEMNARSVLAKYKSKLNQFSDIKD